MSHINYNDVKAIRENLANYEMRVLHTNGVYRHLRFHSPTDPFPGNCSFEVVTWPGHAWIGGDWCGGHTIAREPDMLTQFLNVTRISYDYWAEKMCLTSDVPITRRSELAYEEWVRDTARDLVSDYSLAESDTQDIIDAYMELIDPDHPNVVDWHKLETLGPLEFGVDDGAQDMVEVPLDISDAWELEFTEYTYDFLVACEGLRFAAEKWAERIEGAVE